MAIEKTSGLVTIGGIMAAFGGLLIAIPLGTQAYYATIIKDGPPHWLLVTFLVMYMVGGVLGALGKAIMGVAGQGQASVPTVPQVQAATAQAVSDNLAQQAADPKKDVSLGATSPKS